ncbi:hypothetical protein C2845_PM13G25290 [Panicum miliaceum]|uniref:Uncharacterized protein n=1 Tax=Panicum miliaceum TaxID=4540 RepID=A0A3L6RLH3_PANMI|nr:hypothetical protein C2845_PM13G25290 [Panicum miliaceum]
MLTCAATGDSLPCRLQQDNEPGWVSRDDGSLEMMPPRRRRRRWRHHHSPRCGQSFHPENPVRSENICKITPPTESATPYDAAAIAGKAGQIFRPEHPIPTTAHHQPGNPKIAAMEPPGAALPRCLLAPRVDLLGRATTTPHRIVGAQSSPPQRPDTSNRHASLLPQTHGRIPPDPLLQHQVRQDGGWIRPRGRQIQSPECHQAAPSPRCLARQPQHLALRPSTAAARPLALASSRRAAAPGPRSIALPRRPAAAGHHRRASAQTLPPHLRAQIGPRRV